MWFDFLSKILLFIYIMCLPIALLRPFNFDFRVNRAQWIGGGNGIDFSDQGMLISEKPPRRLHDVLTRGRGLTLEVWVKPRNASQMGPATILSYSRSPARRNFALGQSQQNLVVRIRTTHTDLNAMHPQLELAGVFESGRSIHIAATYDFIETCVYINGKPVVCDDTVGGSFDNWDPSYQLVLGNEVTGNRPWLGQIFYAGIYDRALSGAEIAASFNDRGETKAPSDRGANRPPRAALRYVFDAPLASLLGNERSNPVSVPLFVPARLPETKRFLSFDVANPLTVIIDKDDIFWNVIGFIPLGFLGFRLLRRRGRQTFSAVSLLLAIGFFVSFGFESLQHFLPTRHSSIVDIVTNLGGLAVGILMARLSFLFDRSVSNHIG